jgi:sterol 14-demethylase
MNFAFLQVKTIWSTLLRKFDFELLSNEPPRVDFTAIVAQPGNDCRVRFRRRKDEFSYPPVF